jgi:hypothetical protein
MLTIPKNDIRIPNPVVKKVPDPGSPTLRKIMFFTVILLFINFLSSRIENEHSKNTSRLINEHSKNSKSQIHNTIKWIYADPDPQTQNLSTHTVPYLIPESGSNKNGDAPELVLSLLQKYFENKCSKTETS